MNATTVISVAAGLGIALLAAFAVLAVIG